MEITQTTKTGVSQVTTSIRIEYTLQYRGDAVDVINGRVLKDGAHAGFASVMPTGEIGLNLNGGIVNYQDAQTVFAQLLADASQVFASVEQPPVEAPV
jgi:hypothetical protein